jgi:hypothetical protein
MYASQRVVNTVRGVIMRPKFFGDSYDLVKREIIHGLASDKKWTVHPMYFVFDSEPEPSVNFHQL